MEVEGQGQINGIPPIEEKSEPFVDLTRCHLYSPSGVLNSDLSNINLSNDKPVELTVNLKTRSLPWKRQESLDEEEEDTMAEDMGTEKITCNYSKKRKNRMRNDSAQAIALNKTGQTTGAKVAARFLHRDTDSLVDNEAYVVYDERTAL
jgi:hypothetical protein